MPERIQCKRTKGWRMPAGAVYVGRPTIWGNPFQIRGSGKDRASRQALADRYRLALTGGSCIEDRRRLERWFRNRGWVGSIDSTSPAMYLRGHDLCCWCALDQPCHADVLLDLANA